MLPAVFCGVPRAYTAGAHFLLQTQMIGQTRGHYRIDAKLGEGGMGVVYRARPSVMNEPGKALNWLERAVQNGDERIEWFQRDPLLASIRNQPRFRQILELVAFQRQQRAKQQPPKL